MKTLNELMNEARIEFEETDWQLNWQKYSCKVFGDEIIRQHRYVVEKAMGKQLPLGAEIHHYNGNRSDNRNFNLIVCPNEAYHKLLHERAKVVFGTLYSQETYAAIKKASWEHRHPRGHYRTVKQIRAGSIRKSLEKRDWWPTLKPPQTKESTQ